MFLWSQYLHIWQIHWVFFLIFDGILTKTSQSSLYSPAFFKILKEPALLQKPTISHMKALLFSYLEPEGWGRGIIMGVPRPPPVKLFATFLSEVVEAKRVDFSKKNVIASNVRISWMYRYHFYDSKGHSCDLMDPTKFCPFFTTSCDLMDPKSSCDLMDPNQVFPLSKPHVFWWTQNLMWFDGP